MKTVVMKRSDREKKARQEDYTVPFPPIADDYHRGLVIDLNDDCLTKLGIDQMPKPGDKFRIAGEAHVLSSEQRDTDKNSDRRVEMVLHELGAEKQQNPGRPDKTIREDIEDARHQAHGTLSPSIGARAVNNRR